MLISTFQKTNETFYLEWVSSQKTLVMVRKCSKDRQIYRIRPICTQMHNNQEKSKSCSKHTMTDSTTISQKLITLLHLFLEKCQRDKVSFTTVQQTNLRLTWIISTKYTAVKYSIIPRRRFWKSCTRPKLISECSQLSKMLCLTLMIFKKII